MTPDELKALARSIVDGPGETAGSKGSLVDRLLSPFRSTPARPSRTAKAEPQEVVTHG